MLDDILTKIKELCENLEMLSFNMGESVRSTYLYNTVKMALFSSDLVGIIKDIVSFAETLKMQYRIAGCISKSSNSTLLDVYIGLREEFKLGGYHRKHTKFNRN
ncbi:hypothetical protein [Candidatus Nitrosocosmicus franklandus]|uniref:Uncharacterized protein n=1 Tax=Candidatus Nitrosocosmicus franklandianus TaxID=1798806 RepID=A0A484I5C6_9ARCH|nr:hypothetical protein [Candidatus Nitrosocosmicus franklandus]VFJ12939.1 protein of unknown function [Candidatus Nitrosocosmicus franklandus]